MKKSKKQNKDSKKKLDLDENLKDIDNLEKESNIKKEISEDLEDLEDSEELENLIKESNQLEFTTFTPFISKNFKKTTPTLEQNPILEPIQNLEIELQEIPLQKKQDETTNYETKINYTETSDNESIKPSVYESNSKSQDYENPIPLQRFDPSTGRTFSTKDEVNQFKQWQNFSKDPFQNNNSNNYETYNFKFEKIDNSSHLPFKKDKKKNQFGF